ncbi:MAG: NYN domain-containing protein [Bryobacteraceae bacterium]
MDEKLKIAVFIDFDNIEIGVKSTLQREFDVAAVLDALKERGEIVTKIAYANWGRQESSTRQLAEHAVQMVQRDPSPRGDKNGADINLALDALEMAFTHDHINAFAIVSGDSDFIALVNKLKQYNKIIFVVGGRAFTSTILQKNCHEFVSYESLLDESPRAPRPQQQHPPREQREGQPGSGGGERSQQPPYQPQTSQGHRPGGGHRRPPPLDLNQAMPLVERALQVLERREVRPQLGLLKSTMLQLDSAFNEKAYGAGSFSDFVEKLKKNNLVNVTGGEGRYMISRKESGDSPEKVAARPEASLPVLRDVLESHRLEIDEGCPADALQEWVNAEHPAFDWKAFGFQEFYEMLNYAQDKSLVRVELTEDKGLLVYLGAEFHPPALPEPEPEVVSDEQPPDEPQPIVAGQPTARTPKPKRSPRKKAADDGANPAPRVRRAPRKKAPVE